MGAAQPYVDLGTGRTAKAITAGRHQVCAILDDNRLKCWGRNLGQLGLGDVQNRGDAPGQMGDALPAVSREDEKVAIQIGPPPKPVRQPGRPTGVGRLQPRDAVSGAARGEANTRRERAEATFEAAARAKLLDGDPWEARPYSRGYAS